MCSLNSLLIKHDNINLIILSGRTVSDHERQVVVADTVTDVKGTVESRVESVECVETRPEIIAEVSDRFGTVMDERPAALGEVLHYIIEKSIVVDGFVSLENAHLLGLRDTAEVLPA